MKIFDPGIAHYIYCRDQEEKINLFHAQLGAAGFHVMMGDGDTALSLQKGALLSALLVTMSHALEKGDKPLSVAAEFFDASVIGEAAPGFKGHNEELTTVSTQSEKAEVNAAFQIVQNIMFLTCIAHKSLSNGSFTQQGKLRKDFFDALSDNRWPLEYSARLNKLIDVGFVGSPNNYLDQMLKNAEADFDRQRDSVISSGYECVRPEEYQLRV